MADIEQRIQSLGNVTCGEALRMEKEASEKRVKHQIPIFFFLCLLLVLNWFFYSKDFYERDSFMITISVAVLIGRIIVVLFIKCISELVLKKSIKENLRIISADPQSNIGKESLADLQLSFPSLNR